MESIWDINKIQQILPQRYPFLFIDSVLEINPKDKKVTCLKNVTMNDYFLAGHFPGNPVMPGVLIIEALAQAGIILFAALKPQIAQKSPLYYLGRVEAKFLRPVKVADQLILEVFGEKVTDSAGIVRAVASVNKEVCAQAHLVFGVRIDKTYA